MRVLSERECAHRFFYALRVKIIKTMGAYFAISHILSAWDADRPDCMENALFGKKGMFFVAICGVPCHGRIG